MPSATGSYSSTTGATVTFAVTGGDADLARFTGTVTLGSGLAFADGRTGEIVCPTRWPSAATPRR